LVTEGLAGKYEIQVNSPRPSDITHYHTVNFNYFIDRILTRGRTSGIGYVHFLPETVDDSVCLPWLFKKVFYRYLLTFYNSMDYLVVVNPVVKHKLAALGVTNPSVVYIPNYVSDSVFKPLPNNEIQDIRNGLGYKPDDFVVMGAGQLQTRKGVRDFVETARMLPHIKFMWAGGFSFGKMTDGYEELTALSRNLPENVRFLGIIDREKMAGIYNAADMFFLPSYNELFPMTILEAAACAKPILLRELDFYKDIIDGYYLAADDVTGFANQIEKLAADPRQLKLWADQAYMCHEKYSEASVLGMWERLYDNASVRRERRPVFVFPGRKSVNEKL
jgi:1,2-diacylglycerol-3-alpha-glucose alpha-1,2-galactosyltransferase